MKILLASDHAGYSIKSSLYQNLRLLEGVEVKDLGAHSYAQSDYPEFANKLCEEMKKPENTFGVLVCGSGMGMCIAANRYNHIRCGLCRTTDDAITCREHNNANVIALGARFTAESLALNIAFKFINTEFLGDKDKKYERHRERINQIS